MQKGRWWGYLGPRVCRIIVASFFMDSGAVFTSPAFGIQERLYHKMLPKGLDFLLPKIFGVQGS